MAGPTHPPRRIYLVDRHFQLKYTAFLVAFGGAIMAVFGGALVREVRTSSDLLENNKIFTGDLGKTPGLADFQDAISASDHRLTLLILGVSLMVAVALGLIGILITHRIAGPIYVLARYTQALADGTYPQIRALRRNDELKGFFDVFKLAIDRLRERQLAEVTQIEQLAAKLTGGPAEELRALARVKRESLGLSEADPLAEGA